MKDINEIFKIGDTVEITLGLSITHDEVTGLPAYSRLTQIPIDLNWGKNGFLFDYPDDRNSDYFCHDGDKVTILSKGLEGPSTSISYIFKVKDKNNNTFYLSCEYFKYPIEYVEYLEQEKIERLQEQLAYTKRELQALGKSID
jgi:hypothetical protein